VIPASDPALRIMTSQEVASGLTAVWSRDNTREELFDAMKRKEVYATTGTRIRVRVFGGWDFGVDDLARSDFVSQGYGRGVPMGGELGQTRGGKKPSFLIRALRDPDGANLDRIQVIKGWLDAEGETHERIHDVAVSDARKIGADGRCKKPVGNTVDVEKATYTNAIGDAALSATDTPLDHLRCGILRHQASGQRAGDTPGPRIHIADLVQPLGPPMVGSGTFSSCIGRACRSTVHDF